MSAKIREFRSSYFHVTLPNATKYKIKLVTKILQSGTEQDASLGTNCRIMTVEVDYSSRNLISATIITSDQKIKLN